MRYVTVMVTLPSVAGGLKIQLKGKYVSGNWANVMYAITTGTSPTQADLDTMATALKTLWVSNLGECSHTSVSLTQVLVTNIASDTGLTGVWASTPVLGTIAGTAGPANLAGCISWKIARRYRGGHPRTYIPGISLTSVLDTRLFTTTYVATLLSKALAWRTGINAMTYTSMPLISFSCISYYDKDVNPTPPHLRPVPRTDGIVGATVGNRIDSQRRRLGKE